MPSKAYEQFLRELQATGHARADGFSKSSITPLVGNEREAAKAVLLSMAARGDVSAIPALGYFEAEEVEAELVRLAQGFQSPSLRHAEACSVLWSLTGLGQYADAMVSDLALHEDWNRIAVVTRMARTTMSPVVHEALWHVVESDTGPLVRATAARALLTLAKVTSGWDDTAGFQQLLHELAANEKRVSANAIRQLRSLLGRGQ